MAISHFHAHIIGGDRPVGQYLTRLLAEQDIIYKSVSFSSRERPLLQLQSQARPVFILTPSEAFAAMDGAGELAALMGPPPGLSETEAWVVRGEEGWILGVV